MEIIILIVVTIVAGYYLLFRSAQPDPDERKPAAPRYTFRVEEYEFGSADVCLYINGCYDSMSFVWEKYDGRWKYGSDRPWAGYAATRDMAVEISKKWLIRDAEAKNKAT